MGEHPQRTCILPTVCCHHLSSPRMQIPLQSVTQPIRTARSRCFFYIEPHRKVWRSMGKPLKKHRADGCLWLLDTGHFKEQKVNATWANWGNKTWQLIEEHNMIWLVLSIPSSLGTTVPLVKNTRYLRSASLAIVRQLRPLAKPLTAPTRVLMTKLRIARKEANTKFRCVHVCDCMSSYLHAYIHTYIHCIALHCIAFHHITSHVH